MHNSRPHKERGLHEEEGREDSCGRVDAREERGVVHKPGPRPSAARRALIQRSGGRRDESSSMLTTTDAIHNQMRAGHIASL